MARSNRASSSRKTTSRRTSSRRSNSSPSMGVMNSVKASSSSIGISTGKPSSSSTASRHKLTSDYRPGIGVSHRMRER